MIRNIIISLLLFSALYAQNSDSLNTEKELKIVVDSVAIIGNEITDRDIIIRELTFAPGDTLTREDLKFNRERVFSLNIFTYVALFVREHKDKKVLFIQVKESWYIWPVPFASRVDKDWEKITYGFDLNILNFRGRNERVKFRIGLGYDPQLTMNYSIPYLFPEEQISMQFSLGYNTVKNKSRIAEFLYGGSFEQEFLNGGIGIGKRFDVFNSAGLYLGYNYIETPKFVPGVNLTSGRIDRYGVIQLSYHYDSRDLSHFPTKGFLSSTYLTTKGIGNGKANYHIFGWDVRAYEKLFETFIIKGRLKTRQAFGPVIPYYDHSFLGLGERVRGHFETQYEGNSLFLGSAELHYPIVEEWNFSMKLPLIPEQLTNYRVAIYTHLFGDTGFTNWRDERVSIRDFYTGFGFGVTMLVMPYNSARVEVGFNEKLEPELILDVGLSF